MARKHDYVLHPKRLHLKPKGQDGYILVKEKHTTLVEDIVIQVEDVYLRSNLEVI